MLRRQMESKVREEEMLIRQQQIQYQLTMIQRDVKAAMMQDYELHEYPIPRLFVVLPEGVDPNKPEVSGCGSTSGDEAEERRGYLRRFKNWDPKLLMKDRFRFYFLCECGEHSKTDTALEEAPKSHSTESLPLLQHDTHVHLAPHNGYELSRPTGFFEKYGAYVLRFLQLLQLCLAAFTMAFLAAGLAWNGIKHVADGLKSMSESTLEVVKTSIGILETKLEAYNDAGV
ncbi:hypothetical protein BG011_004226 [Mortierella polycephala]|uniref:Uncharacterized protein n=1 Tax=Mortierella polycephala TaxID=41804 RepID=A0A9P6Q144_9FUNG|nr:hypothetical protein BG011_004226 [Mortierella polycephala]